MYRLVTEWQLQPAHLDMPVITEGDQLCMTGPSAVADMDIQVKVK